VAAGKNIRLKASVMFWGRVTHFGGRSWNIVKYGASVISAVCCTAHQVRIQRRYV